MGQRTRGWRAPLYNFSIHSADLLIEEGFVYDASLMGDDVPYLLRNDQGEIIELPSDWDMDDLPPFVLSMDLDYEMQIRSPSQGLEAVHDFAISRVHRLPASRWRRHRPQATKLLLLDSYRKDANDRSRELRSGSPARSGISRHFPI